MSAISILLVEDDEDLRRILKHHLRSEGYGVTCVNNGRKAIQLVDREKFDLIITDLLMPDGDGIELLTHVSKRKPRPAVIAMSGGGKYMKASQILSLAVQLGALAPLVKPFTKEQLLDAVRSVLGLPNDEKRTPGST